ncbi:MAG: hypothetical protein IPF90_12195 [Actinomycetales bacterium]|nr:hypothetical protein [Candidatus Phosphoribacter baldrii]
MSKETTTCTTDTRVPERPRWASPALDRPFRDDAECEEDRGVSYDSADVDSWRQTEPNPRPARVWIRRYVHDTGIEEPTFVMAEGVWPGCADGLCLTVPDARRLAAALVSAADMAGEDGAAKKADDVQSAFEAGRAHERGEIAARIGAGVQVPSIPWANSLTVTPPAVDGDPWEIDARRQFHPFVRVCGSFRQVGQVWERVDLEVEVDDFESTDIDELSKVGAAFGEAARFMKSELFG